MSKKYTMPKELPKRYSARLFAVGGILLLVPFAFVLFEGSSCANATPTCLSSGTTKFINTIFPYPMLAGGLLIGYGMKRLADSKQAESEAEEETATDEI
ncbi:MAG: hypothetical protein ACYCPW_13160 [Nitrososphaerales archaeon]